MGGYGLFTCPYIPFSYGFFTCAYIIPFCFMSTIYMMNTGDNKQSNTIQHNTTTPETTLFSKENELSQVGFEPTTLHSLDECSAN